MIDITKRKTDNKEFDWRVFDRHELKMLIKVKEHRINKITDLIDELLDLGVTLTSDQMAKLNKERDKLFYERREIALYLDSIIR